MKIDDSKTIRLYDGKRSCELCSSTFVRRRVDDLVDHVRQHEAAGEVVIERDGEYFIQTGEQT